MFLIDSLISTLKKSFTFAGRASRFEFWSCAIAFILLAIILQVIGLGLGLIWGKLGIAWEFLSALVLLALIIPYISVSVRRLHDLGLSGFWLWYLNPFGLPVIYIVYLLDLDMACNKLVEKISKIGSVWLGWILTILFFPIGATAALFLLFLYKGKPEANEFGPAPVCPCCCESEGKTEVSAPEA